MPSLTADIEYLRSLASGKQSSGNANIEYLKSLAKLTTANGPVVSDESYANITPEERQRRIDSWNAGVDPMDTGLWASVKRAPSAFKEGVQSGLSTLFNTATGGYYQNAIGYDAEAEGKPFADVIAERNDRTARKNTLTAGESGTGNAVLGASTAMGEMTPALVSGGLAKAIGATNATGTVYAVMTGTYGPKYFAEAKRKGKTGLEAAGYAATQTAIELATSYAGMKVAGKVGGTTLEGMFGTGPVKSVSGALLGTAVEGGEEVVAQYLQNLTNIISGVDPKAFDNLGEQTVQTFAVGALLGSAVNAGGYLAEKVQPFLDKPSRTTARKADIPPEMANSKAKREALAEAAMEAATTQADPIANETKRLQAILDRAMPKSGGIVEPREDGRFSINLGDKGSVEFYEKEQLTFATEQDKEQFIVSNLQNYGWKDTPGNREAIQKIEAAFRMRLPSESQERDALGVVVLMQGTKMSADKLLRHELIHMTLNNGIVSESDIEKWAKANKMEGATFAQISEALAQKGTDWGGIGTKIEDFFRAILEMMGLSDADVRQIEKNIFSGAAIRGETSPTTQPAPTAPTSPVDASQPEAATESSGLARAIHEQPQEAEPVAEATTPPVPPAEPHIPDSSQAGFVPNAFFQLDAIRETAGRGVRNLRRWVQQNFTSHGEKNNATVDLLTRRDGYMRRQLSELQQNMVMLQRAAKRSYGVPAYRQLPDTVGQTLDDALKGNTPINQLPQDVAIEVQRIRDHIDALSQHVMSLPGISSDLQMSITNNMGVYVTRTYKKFGAGKDAWIRRALGDQQIMADFATDVRQVAPQATDEEIQQLAAVLLNRNTTDLNDMGRITPRSQQYVNVLRQRQNLSPAVRRLYGERTDVFENYAETVSRVASLAANRTFVNELRNAGIQQGFFTDLNGQQPANQNRAHIKEVNHREIPQLRPMAGLLMEPEVADSINDIYATHLDGPAMRTYMAAMGLFKASKTVGSIQATIRNLTGNIPIAVANGSFNARDFSGAARDTFFVELFQRGTAADKARLRRYHELGLIEGVSVEALADIAKQVSVSVQDYLAGVDSVSGMKGVGRAIPKFYQSMDVVWKIYGYENELRILRQAHPNMPQAEVEQMAADRMRNLTPTHSAASKAAKFWSRKVPVGDFAMFYAEMIRTSANRMRIIREDMASGNPVLQRHAVRRIAGQTAVLAVPAMLAAVSRAMLGVSDDEDEAMRQRIAPWQKNSPLIYTSFNREKGRFEYFDGSYNDPFSGFSKPAIAMLRGEPGEAADAATEPFLSESMLIGTVAGVAYNQKPDGGRVYDPGQSPEVQNKQIRDWVIQRAEPGVVTTMRRISRGAKGTVSESGKAYELGNELTAIGGVRLEGMDRSQSDGYRNREFHANIEAAQSAIRRTMMGKGTFDAETAREQYLSAEQNRKQLLKDWRKFVDGSVVLGETDPLKKIVTDVGRMSMITKLMYTQQYRPYLFSDADKARMSKLPQGDERLKLYMELDTELAQNADNK